MEDSAIIDLYWAREERALSETDAKYGGYCRSIAHNILKNREDSEECVSDTWLHAWNAMPPQRPSILSSFLGRITRNLSFDRCRRQNAEKRGGGSPFPQEAAYFTVPGRTSADRHCMPPQGPAQVLRLNLPASGAMHP